MAKKPNFKTTTNPMETWQSIDEVMVKWTGRLSFKKYLPPKPIKKGIKIWMRCDSVNAYLIDFEIYLRKGTQVSEHGLGTKLSHD